MFLIAIALLGGLSVSLIGTGYNLGNRRGIGTSYVALFLFIAGSLYFGFKTAWLPYGDYRLVYQLGLLQGIINIVITLLIQTAVRRGHFTSMWIAVNLNFVPQALFCAIVYHESISLFQKLGLLTGTACIVLLAFKPHETPSATAHPAHGRGLLAFLGLLLLLLGLLVSNSISAMFMKVISYQTAASGENLWTRGQDLFYALMYMASFLLLLPYLALTYPVRQHLRSVLLPGLFAGTGSVAGMCFMAYCIGHQMSGTLCFPLISIVSILAANITAVAVFREKLSGFWFAGNGLAVTSIILFLF